MNEQASCLKEPFKFTTMKYICLEEASRIKKIHRTKSNFLTIWPKFYQSYIGTNPRDRPTMLL